LYCRKEGICRKDGVIHCIYYTTALVNVDWWGWCVSVYVRVKVVKKICTDYKDKNQGMRINIFTHVIK